MNFASNKRFHYFQPKTPFVYSDFFAKTITKHLQLYLFFSDNNQFKNNIERVFGSNKLV